MCRRQALAKHTACTAEAASHSRAVAASTLQVVESGGVKGRQALATHAACVYMACRLEHNPRTFKEVLAGAPGTNKVGFNLRLVTS